MARAGEATESEYSVRAVGRTGEDTKPGAPPGFEATLYSDASFSGGPAYAGIGPLLAVQCDFDA